MFPLFRNSITGELIHDGSTQDTTLSRFTSECKIEKNSSSLIFTISYRFYSFVLPFLSNSKIQEKLQHLEVFLAFWYILSALSNCQILACQTLHLSNHGYIFFIFLTFFAETFFHVCIYTVFLLLEYRFKNI